MEEMTFTWEVEDVTWKEIIRLENHLKCNASRRIRNEGIP